MTLYNYVHSTIINHAVSQSSPKLSGLQLPSFPLLFTFPSIRSHILGFQVPTITDLRNPALKPRHWTLIEEVIGYKFDPESPLTLRTLIDLDVFDHAEAIQEVSGQASSESSLEAILKKVMFTVTTVCIIHQYTVALFVL